MPKMTGAKKKAFLARMAKGRRAAAKSGSKSKRKSKRSDSKSSRMDSMRMMNIIDEFLKKNTVREITFKK